MPDGDAVVGPVNELQTRFRHVVLTQDGHPPGHVSFAGRRPGRAAFETVRLAYGEQVLWPAHCVAGTPGAAFASGLDTGRAALVIGKGAAPETDSQSAFVEADGRTRTGLAGAPAERGVTRVVLCGLATDQCVRASALDARAAGFEAAAVADAVRGIDGPRPTGGSVAAAWAAAGVCRIGRAEIG